MGNLFCFSSSEDDVNATTTGTKYIANPDIAIPDSDQNELKSESNEDEVWRVGLGAGCYWGTEKFIGNAFPKRSDNPTGSLVQGSGQVGFMGPASAPSNPSYEDVCTGRTGHVEVYDVSFKGGAAYFEAMLKFFYMIHDPTTQNRQGNDTGTQYASVIYCYNQEQFAIATKVKEQVQTYINTKQIKAYSSVRVTTDIRLTKDASPFFAAHKEHQDYLTKNPNGYCNHGFKFKEWPQPSSSSDE